jgi:hypothetical protein
MVCGNLRNGNAGHGGQSQGSELQRVTAIGDQMSLARQQKQRSLRRLVSPLSGTGSRGTRENDAGHWRRL